MSRILEIETDDNADVVAKRAFTAFRRVGRVIEYDPVQSVEGKIYIRGYPAYVIVEWRPAKGGTVMRVDISATSGDELSRAADQAMYRFARMFKAVQTKDFVEPEALRRRSLAYWASAGLFTVIALITAAMLGLFRTGS